MGTLNPNTDCSSCGGRFYASPGHLKRGWGKFCSLACRSKVHAGAGHSSWRGGLVEAKCGRCGKAFGIKPSRVERGEGKFCSRKCQHEGGSYDTHCEHCGKGFRTYRSLGSKFCSRECNDAARAPQPNCTCTECGERFYVKPADLARDTKVGVGRFCSMRCKAKWMSSHPRENDNKRGHGGKRQDLGGRYFRSAWEANWARYLNWLVSIHQLEKWEYEVETFEFHRIKRGTRFYTPDFKLTNMDGSTEFHEVKGWMDPKSATKLRRMAKYYPAIKITVIDRVAYKDVNKKLAGLIPGWERFKG